MQKYTNLDLLGSDGLLIYDGFNHYRPAKISVEPVVVSVDYDTGEFFFSGYEEGQAVGANEQVVYLRVAE